MLKKFSLRPEGAHAPPGYAYADEWQCVYLCSSQIQFIYFELLSTM